ncbi:MAG: type II toxin-antitoxin system HicB family antitoxin [Bryobacteraceae bacterium]
MRELRYGARFKREKNGGYSVSFPDFPDAFTSGKDLNQARAMAADCLAEAIAARIHDGEDIPAPTYGAKAIAVPLPMAFKAALHQAMRDQGISNSALARRLGRDEKVVRQLLDTKRTGSRLESFEEALRAVGMEATVSIHRAA